MKLIIGLGNPGEKYLNTRHNVGFLAIDNFLKTNHGQVTWESNFESRIVTTTIENEKVLFIKPQTFMNESGRAVSAALNFYKVSVAENILIIHDDVDLPLGTVRETNSASSAGHNGIKSIIEHLGTQNFYRLRIGVETREDRTHMPTDAFVLQNFTTQELSLLTNQILPEIDEKIELFLEK